MGQETLFTEKIQRCKNRRKQVFSGVCERLGKYHPDLSVVIQLCPCLYLTYAIFFSFMNVRIIVLLRILMSFPDNYVMYILTVFLLIDFSLIMDIFLLLCTLEFFSF